MARKVLLIEHEARSIERVRSVLFAPDYAVFEAHDGEEGLSAFGASRYDLIVLSGMLPRLPSAEVIREIRRKGGATAPPILLLVSGYRGANRKADAQRVGAFDILVKPFEDEALREAVRQAIESTDVGARSMKISMTDVEASARFTSEDIFSDVLEDIGGEAARPAPPTAVPRPPLSAADEVDRRLRDSLSGILGNRTPPPGTTVPPAATPPASAPVEAPSVRPSAQTPRFSTDADIDRMIQDTLSGLRVSQKPKPASAEKPASRPAAPPASVSGPDPDHFGQYEILEKVASGGMAEVYKARRSGVEGFQKIVAIKKILPHLADNEQFIGMFADEAKLAAQLSHPNIVHIYDLGKIEAGGYFIAMEYVDGRELRALLQSARDVATPMPVPLAIYVASKVASALDYAHRRRDPSGRELSIVHRDVSPQNILISYEGDIKLCDFGIAKAASKVSTTQSGVLKGKLQYMSPEQAWGRPIDRRSDLFSLGCVLFEMLTEEKLFRGDNDLNLLEKVRAAEAPAPSSLNPEVPKSLDAIVGKALAREPDDRYANASDLLRDLEAVLYSYQPAPGSADLAIYLNRIQAEEAAAAEASASSAEHEAAVVEPAKKRRSKGTPVARRTGSAPRFVDDLAAAPAPSASAEPPPPAPAAATPPAFPSGATAGVYGASPAARATAEAKGRGLLYTGIAAAVALLVGAALWLMLRPSGSAKPVPAAVATPLPALSPGSASAATPAPAPPAASAAARVPTAAPPGYDPKAVEAEVQRQLAAAARKKEAQKDQEQPAPATPEPVRETATISPQPSPVPTEPPAREAVPTAEPTAAPTRAPVTAVEAPARSAGEVTRGELVGPGPGVVEPQLVVPPRVAYPALARQQRVSGRVIILVLVDENGNVADSRVQQGISSKLGVNEAVLEAVRKSKFKSATKAGVPVKMWRTIVVDVQP